MKNRPHLEDSDKYKIERVNEFSKEGDYLKSKFYKSKISEGTNSIYGYKEFEVPKNFKGYDRGFYETLKGNNSKKMFATYVRQAELGEFKNNELNGFGARYVSQEFGYKGDNLEDECRCDGIIGYFINGLPHKKSYLYTEHLDHERSEYALARWDNGKLITANWGYKDKDINIEDEIQDSILWGGNPFGIFGKSERFWENYKNIFL
tara:strand:- start:56 stop:673 length:618 start_codon:yes stop_codon:yes gene_type:complete